MATDLIIIEGLTVDTLVAVSENGKKWLLQHRNSDRISLPISEMRELIQMITDLKVENREADNHNFSCVP